MTRNPVTVKAITVAGDASFDWVVWDHFVESCPGGTFYHRHGWLEAVAIGLGHDIRLHVARDTQGQLRAGAFVRRAAKLGFCAGRKPWGTGYNGIIAARQDGPAVAALRAELLRTYQQVRLVQTPEPETAEAQAPWRVKSNMTPVLDLHEVHRLWDSFDRHARQRVRKAAGLGVTANESTGFRDFANLYRLTYERQCLPMPLPPEAIEGVLRRAVASGDARLFMAKTPLGEPAAGLLVGILGRRAWFVLAASHPMHRKSDAVSLLWWHAMEQCAGPVTEIDLVGHGVRRIDQFKRSFSPRLVEHTEWEAFGKGPRAWALRALDQRRTRIHELETHT